MARRHWSTPVYLAHVWLQVVVVHAAATLRDLVSTDLPNDMKHSHNETEKFYEELNNIKSNLKSQDVKIAMGDFNAKVGNERIEDTVGPHGIGDIKARGELLKELYGEHDYFITNTWFQNNPRRWWTWMSPGDRSKNQIDFIIAPKRFRNAILSSRSMEGADCGSDHVSVVCMMRIKRKKFLKSPSNPQRFNTTL
ncbi:craniofacial development protein 2-like [Elysia marginata]|uniref:Craniofacial development protein 2-like n=1 Tax=Elysia marginata TaxID=1093978 RepID=A0AAV4I1Y5_9GAST|nr:craniofacial development protein 2-like [Elysia marginata]